VPVLPSFNLMLTYNPGAAFSFLAGAGGWQRWFFLSLGTAISIALVVWLTRLRPEEKRLGLALALILGGAIGNLIDRAWLGQVIDFIQLYYDRWYWPTFNIADSAISIGAALLVLDSLLGEPRQPSNPETRS
jgi:signal peptidase II